MAANQELTRDIVVSCHHCVTPVLIEKLNCCIFRHGILMVSGQQMNPHETKEVCDFFVANNMIYGCGKPFKIIENENKRGEFVAVKCEYI
jgi:hypothetical protein